MDAHKFFPNLHSEAEVRRSGLDELEFGSLNQEDGNHIEGPLPKKKFIML